MDTTSIDRLLGRVPPRKTDLLLLFYRAHNQTWVIAWNAGDNLGALQAAVDWSTNPQLDFDLADAVRVNEKITLATCEGKGDIDAEHRRAEGQ